MTRLQRDTVGYVVIALGSIALLAWIIPAYTPPYPGYGASPALVPNVAAGAMLVMALLALVRNVLTFWFGKTQSPDECEYPDEGASGFTQVGRIDLLHLARIVIPCALLIPALEWVGFVPASIAFMLLMQYLVGSREPVRAVVLSLAVVGVMYVTMRYGFSVPLPGS